MSWNWVKQGCETGHSTPHTRNEYLLYFDLYSICVSVCVWVCMCMCMCLCLESLVVIKVDFWEVVGVYVSIDRQADTTQYRSYTQEHLSHMHTHNLNTSDITVSLPLLPLSLPPSIDHLLLLLYGAIQPGHYQFSSFHLVCLNYVFAKGLLSAPWLDFDWTQHYQPDNIWSTNALFNSTFHSKTLFNFLTLSTELDV